MALHAATADGIHTSSSAETESLYGHTMRSKVHVGLSISGSIEIQLSRAIPANGVEPPHINTFTGSVYGEN